MRATAVLDGGRQVGRRGIGPGGVRQDSSAFAIAGPDADRDRGKAGAIGFDERSRDLAGADDQQPPPLRPREQAGAEKRVRGRLPARDQRGVDDALEPAGGLGEEQQRTLSRGKAGVGVAGG